jgi:hypothetical protein
MPSVSKFETPQRPILPGAQFLESLDRTFKRVPARPVQQVEINPVGPKPLQAGFAGRDGALAAGI